MLENGIDDVVHATRDGFSQKSDRCIDIAGRPPYQLVTLSPGKLHGLVTHAVQDHRWAKQREVSGGLSIVPFLLELFIIGNEEG